MAFAPLPEILAEIAAGRMVILVDDARRENEGDLLVAAERVTPEIINFMAAQGRGLICLALAGEKLAQLNLPLMTAENSSRFGTAFTVSIDAAQGVTTGISAADRARTILTALSADCRPQDLTRPGHVFPLRARDGGVLVRAGQTEGAVDLARLAGLQPAGVICEIMNPDGTMARLPQLEEFAARHGLKICAVADIIAWRHQRERLVERAGESALPTRFGDFTLRLYRSRLSRALHLALVRGEVGGVEPVLVRVHSECITGDVFGSLRCDCGQQLRRALARVGRQGRGVILYMVNHEGRGIGLEHKIRAYALQERGLDTVEANEALGFAPDLRTYGEGAQILADLGVRRIRLLTNNPRKVVGLEGYGLEIVERLPLEVAPGRENRRYLEAKRRKLGHILGIEGLAVGEGEESSPAATAKKEEDS